MTFFEPCSTMAIWKASLLALATVLSALCTSTINHYVSLFFKKSCS